VWKIVEFRAVSQRGWGVLSGCDNNPDHNVPSRYEKIYGFLELPDTPEEWLDGFNTFSIYQVLPQIIELWGLNTQTDVQAKKNFVRLTGK